MAPRNQRQSGSDYDPTRDPTSDTYFERRDTVQTGAETHDDVANRVTSEDEQSWWLQRWLSSFTRDGRIRDTYAQDMDARARSLAQGIDTRQGPIMQCSNYMATPHPELKTMVTEDARPADVGDTGDMWITAGNEMVKFQNNVATAINSSAAEWEGNAGDAARTFMAGIGDWVGAAGQSAQLAGTQMNLQSVALDEAKRTMPDPVDFNLDAANQDLQSTTNPIDYINKLGTYQAQYNQQQAAHEEAAGVVGLYDSSLAGASTMPAFGPPPQLATTNIGETVVGNDKVGETGTNNLFSNTNTSSRTGSGGTEQPGDGSVPPPSVPGDPGDPGGPSNPNNPNNPNGPSGPSSPPGPAGPNTPLPGPGGGGGGSGGGGTSPSGDLPGLPGPGQFPTPGQGGGGGGGQPAPNPGIGTPLPIGGLPGPSGGDFDRGNRGPGGGGRGFGPGTGGFGGGPGSSYGPGSGGAGGYGPGGGQGGGPGSGRGPGVGGFGPGGALAAAEGGAVGRGGPAGARGAGGGMMPMGGKRGEGDEDGEHQRASYLVEGDPDAVFGTDEMTAPPVIGE
jgi:hypothetical protein